MEHPYPTLREVAAIWLDAQRHNVRSSSLDQYRRIVDRICSTLGDTPLDALTPMVALQFTQARIRQGVAPSTATRDARLLRSITRWAAEMGVSEDPLRGMPRSMARAEEEPRNPARPFTEEEWRAFSSRVREDDQLRRVPQLPYFLTMMETGARAGELAGSRWRALDLEAEVLVVEPATAKTRRTRALPLSPALVPELRRLVPIHEGLYGRKLETQDLVFLTPRGNPMNKRNARAYFDLVLKRCGIAKRDDRSRRLSPHALRHSFASRLARQGVSLVVAQKLLGHASPNLTASLYTHLQVDELRAALADRLWGCGDTSPPDRYGGSTGRIAPGQPRRPALTGPTVVRHPALRGRVLLLAAEDMGPLEHRRLLAALAAGDVLLVGSDFDGGQER